MRNFLLAGKEYVFHIFRNTRESLFHKTPKISYSGGGSKLTAVWKYFIISSLHNPHLTFKNLSLLFHHNELFLLIRTNVCGSFWHSLKAFHSVRLIKINRWKLIKICKVGFWGIYFNLTDCTYIKRSLVYKY